MRVLRKIAGLCRQVPMLPITIVAALPVALLWNFRPWDAPDMWHKFGGDGAMWPLNPSVGQIIVVVLVAYSIWDSLKSMTAAIEAGHVGIDVLALLALISTLGVQEYWASWAVVLMIWSGEAIEQFAQDKAEGNLSALVAAAPQVAHVSDVQGGSRGATLDWAPQRDAEGFRATISADSPDAGGDVARLQASQSAIAAEDCTCVLAPVAKDGAMGEKASNRSKSVESKQSERSNHQSVESQQLLGLGQTIDSAESSESGQPATSAQYMRMTQSRVLAQPVQSAESLESRESQGTTQFESSVEFAELSQSAKPSRSTRSAQSDQSIKTTEPNESINESAGPQPTPDQKAHFHTVPVDQVALGDVLVVLPGETVPVDGELLSGSATLDLSAINGEPLPRTVFAGARVMSGAVNGATVMTVRATQLAVDSQYQQTMQLVDSARSSRAPVVKTADALAVPFTIISMLIAGVAWVCSGSPLRFAQVLVLATPCPLLIAAPVAYMAGTGRLAKAGILVKTQEVLENLGKASHVFFDKTGTLTVTKPQVVRVDVPPEAHRRLADGLAREVRPDGSRSPASHQRVEDVVLEMAAVVETYSVHILAQGIVAAGAAASAQLHGKTDFPVVRDVEEDAGNGVAGVIDGHLVRVGRLGFVQGYEQCFVTDKDKTVAKDGGLVTNISDHIIDGHSSQPERRDARSETAANNADAVSPSDSVGSSSSEISAPVVANLATEPGVKPQNVAASDPSAISQGVTNDSPADLFPSTLFPERAADEMVAYVSIDELLAARIVLRDVPRADSSESLRRLRSMGVDKVTMLTGDARNSAEVIAREVGIEDVRAELLPQDKVAAVKDAARETPYHTPAAAVWFMRLLTGAKPRPISVMVGDGVNDAPVLAAADIGIAMTDGTSTAASQTAQVVIMNDDIADVPTAIAIARQTKRTMLQAVVTGLALAIVCMVAAAFDLIPVVVGAFMQEGIDVVSILWALTALRERKSQ
ncbi:HAD-IC family P-type ATPase [Bifidobacterium sp. ESL0790]|uniref:HAD-IC family P-type ATPase n=1 Tax=Bifidobacterium sp. ESL0790 TaxID=2983233 RepID=UPI0023F8FBF9|nr:HAD-IC family P-type ATPase [Bifidobacterium sp. ESL0790]WEV72398.1 HAD-IC family P-type ATPase [Bifidobacterium sp. ESL0790]